MYIVERIHYIYIYIYLYIYELYDDASGILGFRGATSLAGMQSNPMAFVGLSRGSLLKLRESELMYTTAASPLAKQTVQVCYFVTAYVFNFAR